MLCLLNSFTDVHTPITADVESYSDEMQYGNYLSYEQVDEDEDGILDYVKISDCDESATEIVIPSEIDGLSVTTIGQEAFSSCKGLVSIEIPDSVKYIEVGTFGGTALLENQMGIKYADKWIVDCDEHILYPEIKKDTIGIGNNAFDGCNSLVSINIPDSVTSIGYRAFKELLISQITFSRIRFAFRKYVPDSGQEHTA